MNKHIQIAERANTVADILSRELLIHLLPEEPFHMSQLLKPRPDAKYNLYKILESGIAEIFAPFQKTDYWRGIIEERNRLEQSLDERNKARVTRARNIFQRLDFVHLIPYYLDYKKRGPEYALTKWSETLPIQKVKAKITPNRQSEPNIIRIPLKKVEEKEEKKS